MKTRAATTSDVQAAAVTLAGAFAADPVWGWAFSELAQLEVWWRFWIQGALPLGWVQMTDDAGAVAVWIPPGGTECPPEDEPHIATLLQVLIGDRAALVLETLDQFDTHRPHETPHYYLSLLGTAPAHRGHGIGMALVADGLARIDEEHAPAYLESSNPVNLPRYESVGFVARDEFTLPDESTVITTMWRDPR